MCQLPWDRIYPSTSVFLCRLSFHWFSILFFSIFCSWYNMPVSGCSTKEFSLTWLIWLQNLIVSRNSLQLFFWFNVYVILLSQLITWCSGCVVKWSITKVQVLCHRLVNNEMNFSHALMLHYFLFQVPNRVFFIYYYLSGAVSVQFCVFPADMCDWVLCCSLHHSFDNELSWVQLQSSWTFCLCLYTFV